MKVNEVFTLIPYFILPIDIDNITLVKETDHKFLT